MLIPKSIQLETGSAIPGRTKNKCNYSA